MKKALKIIFSIFSLIVVVILLFLNIRLYTGPELGNKNALKKDVKLQLNFLENQLKNFELGKEMQKLYPEGFVFINVLYGLTWCEIAKHEDEKSEEYRKAMTEARYAFGETNTEDAKNIYDGELVPAYGIFYRGWQNYLLGEMLSVQTIKDSMEIRKFKANCGDIANAISVNKSPYLESYRHSAWPADAFVAVASLKLHGKLFDEKYDTVIQNWIVKVKANLDSFTQLIPHKADYNSGKVIEGARGSSISLILLFLSSIDHEFAKQQFENYKKYFLVKRLGLPAIREYPIGKEGKGDVDSGPVILDMSFPGTIVSVGTFQKFGEYITAMKISFNIESFGLGYVFGNEKKFLLGKYPVADAFIAWTRMQSANEEISKNKNSNEYRTAIYFHLLSGLFIFLLFFLVKKTFRL